MADVLKYVKFDRFMDDGALNVTKVEYCCVLSHFINDDGAFQEETREKSGIAIAVEHISMASRTRGKGGSSAYSCDPVIVSKRVMRDHWT